jgi:hypothetical protein
VSLQWKLFLIAQGGGKPSKPVYLEVLKEARKLLAQFTGKKKQNRAVESLSEIPGREREPTSSCRQNQRIHEGPNTSPHPFNPCTLDPVHGTSGALQVESDGTSLAVAADLMEPWRNGETFHAEAVDQDGDTSMTLDKHCHISPKQHLWSPASSPFIVKSTSSFPSHLDLSSIAFNELKEGGVTAANIKLGPDLSPKPIEQKRPFHPTAQLEPLHPSHEVAMIALPGVPHDSRPSGVELPAVGNKGTRRGVNHTLAGDISIWPGSGGHHSHRASQQDAAIGWREEDAGSWVTSGDNFSSDTQARLQGTPLSSLIGVDMHKRLRLGEIQQGRRTHFPQSYVRAPLADDNDNDNDDGDDNRNESPWVHQPALLLSLPPLKGWISKGSSGRSRNSHSFRTSRRRPFATNTTESLVPQVSQSGSGQSSNSESTAVELGICPPTETFCDPSILRSRYRRRVAVSSNLGRGMLSNRSPVTSNE